MYLFTDLFTIHFGSTLSMQKFLGQESNLHHSSDLSCCRNILKLLRWNGAHQLTLENHASLTELYKGSETLKK